MKGTIDRRKYDAFRRLHEKGFQIEKLKSREGEPMLIYMLNNMEIDETCVESNEITTAVEYFPQMTHNDAPAIPRFEFTNNRFFELVAIRGNIEDLRSQSFATGSEEIFAWEIALLKRNSIIFEAFVENGLKIEGLRVIDLLRKFIKDNDRDMIQLMVRADGVLNTANK